ncbi:hypothetical protein VTK56DRAFT_778 [Thermocarpiscus australiensis]
MGHVKPGTRHRDRPIVTQAPRIDKTTGRWFLARWTALKESLLREQGWARAPRLKSIEFWRKKKQKKNFSTLNVAPLFRSYSGASLMIASTPLRVPRVGWHYTDGAIAYFVASDC